MLFRSLLSHVQTHALKFERLLHSAFEDHPHVGDIRGRGFFWAVELVEDRASKQWFDPSLKLHAQIKASALRAGLMVYPMGGTVDGQHGDHILLAPPFIASARDLEAIVQRLQDAINQALDIGN